MVKKVTHGIESCEDCMKILLILMDHDKVRFNELVRLGQKTISPKFSAPTLQRHLSGLKKYVKKIKVQPHQVEYSLTWPKEKREEAREKYEFEVKKLQNLSLEQLAKRFITLSDVMAYQEMIIFMKKRLKKESPEKLAFEIEASRFYFKDHWNLIREAMYDRKETEYLETLKKLKDELDSALANHTLRT